MTFDEMCYKELVRKDRVTAVIFAQKAPKNQHTTLKKWFLAEISNIEKEKKQNEGMS